MVTRLLADRRVRRAAAIAVGVGLLVAIVLQRETVVEAVVRLRTLSVPILAALTVLAVLDRVLRAEVIRSLLPQLSLARSEVIGDVGAAASKGLPLGGPVGTVLRWQIAKERNVDAVAFVAMLVASGVAAAFASWTFSLVSTVVDTLGRSTDIADAAIIAVAVVVLVGSLVFWVFVLRSDRVYNWLLSWSPWLMTRLTAMIPSLADSDPEQTLTRLRATLRSVGARPFPLMTRTAVAQVNGALILWLALQGIGVGPELGVSEFARVFFVTHVVGSFAPTPGGVGLIEAGLAGALIAAGVEGSIALAGVLIYRFITFVLPIIIGAVLYVIWQRRRAVELVR